MTMTTLLNVRITLSGDKLELKTHLDFVFVTHLVVFSEFRITHTCSI